MKPFPLISQTTIDELSELGEFADLARQIKEDRGNLLRLRAELAAGLPYLPEFSQDSLARRVSALIDLVDSILRDSQARRADGGRTEQLVRSALTVWRERQP